jgi:hypothetical protein
MSEMIPLIEPNCTSEDVSARLKEVLAQLSPQQIRYVIARQECNTDVEAAKAIGVSVSSIKHWPAMVKDAARLFAQDTALVARHIRNQHLAKAMSVKVKGLDDKDARVRQAAATEIIEWELGKAEETLNVRDVDAAIARELARVAGKGQAALLSEVVSDTDAE